MDVCVYYKVFKLYKGVVYFVKILQGWMGMFAALCENALCSNMRRFFISLIS